MVPSATSVVAFRSLASARIDMTNGRTEPSRLSFSSTASPRTALVAEGIQEHSIETRSNPVNRMRIKETNQDRFERIEKRGRSFLLLIHTRQHSAVVKLDYTYFFFWHLDSSPDEEPTSQSAVCFLSIGRFDASSSRPFVVFWCHDAASRMPLDPLSPPYPTHISPLRIVYQLFLWYSCNEVIF